MKMPSLSDWGLMLLALALAIVIYHSLKTETASHDGNHERHLFQYR